MAKTTSGLSPQLEICRDMKLHHSLGAVERALLVQGTLAAACANNPGKTKDIRALGFKECLHVMHLRAKAAISCLRLALLLDQPSQQAYMVLSSGIAARSRATSKLATKAGSHYS